MTRCLAKQLALKKHFNAERESCLETEFKNQGKKRHSHQWWGAELLVLHNGLKLIDAAKTKKVMEFVRGKSNTKILKERF